MENTNSSRAALQFVSRFTTISATALIALACTLRTDPEDVGSGIDSKLQANSKGWSNQHPFPICAPFLLSVANPNVSSGYWQVATTPSFTPAGPAKAVDVRGDVAAAAFGTDVHIFQSSDLTSLTGWGFAQSISATSAMQGDFGRSLAIGTGVIAVGAPTNTSSQNGYVSIYERGQQTWSPVVDLTAPDPQGTSGTAGMAFGSSLALEGDTLVVGAANFDYSFPNILSNKDDLGIVYVYQRLNGQWTLAQRLSPLSFEWLPYPGFGQAANYSLPGDGFPGDGYGFGQTVALSGDWLAIGAVDADCIGSTLGWCGRVHLYHRNASGFWAPERLIKPQTPGVTGFGVEIALDGDRLAVRSLGVAFQPPQLTEVFQRNPATGAWSFVGPAVSESRVLSIALTGNSLLVAVNTQSISTPSLVRSFGVDTAIKPTWLGFASPTTATATFGGALKASGSWAIVADDSAQTISLYRHGDCAP